ncbi:hypothetical protein FE783_12570 [Paenibacillus mesophilus]|uniref:hypothetical protein n=1 Tax=Paenibacillus mesophilus TaxID=2582849 RepID=UPI00110D4A90|nr:hypothetical protein [Paenibacillus mesophilus]TMV49343.1 hypothetical protein FE783_12570 [Paenibacillus mesophilus]
MNTKGRTTRIKADSTPEKYQNILNIINEEIQNPEGSFTSEQFDDFVFNILMYDNTNYEYVLRFNEFFADSEMSVNKVHAHLKTNTSLQFNKMLTEKIDFGKKYKLCTTRVEFNQSKLVACHLIIRLGNVEQQYGFTNFFACITVDIINRLIIIRFNQAQLEVFCKEAKKEQLALINELKEMLSGNSSNGDDLSPLSLNVNFLDEYAGSTVIFNLFKELSEEAEEMLRERIKPETEEKIRKFLIDMGLKKIEDEYIEQIKAVIYQDVANTISPSLFKKGWIFRFHFSEGDHTRATSKHEDRGPIYSSKTYWQLKELIKEEMREGGYHWKMTKTDEFVDVKIISRNATMILDYYVQMRKDRKEKDEFVIRKISEHLS